jgi:hypothetical protein
MVDPRKEQRAGIGGGSILAEEPQMVTSIKALKARSEDRITVILSQLEGLVHPAISVSKIRRLRVAEVNAQALSPTGGGGGQYARYNTINFRLTARSRLQIARSHRPKGPQAS